MRIGNWEVWNDRASEGRYEFTASNGVTISLYEQFDEEYSITADGARAPATSTAQRIGSTTTRASLRQRMSSLWRMSPHRKRIR